MEEIAKNLKAFLKAEFITGKSLIDWLMLSIGLLLQVIVIIISIITNTFEGIGLVISNLTGVIFVTLCAQGKVSSYLFHLIHIVTYIYIISQYRIDFGGSLLKTLFIDKTRPISNLSLTIRFYDNLYISYIEDNVEDTILKFVREDTKCID